VAHVPCSNRHLRNHKLGHIPFEEEKMRRQFGASFDAYASKVRRWI
jgi:protein-S-isoprenylcysteine O-methyltransferase Ste14